MNVAGRVRRIPWGTLALAAVAVGAGLVPGVDGVLALDRERVMSGEWWRLVTGHFHHFSTAHGAADTAGLLVLGGLLESRDRRCWVMAVGLTLFVTGGVVLGLEPALMRYGGLSALVQACAAALASGWIREGTRLERAAGVGLLAWIGAGLAGWMDGGVLPDGVELCRTAHAAGAAAGLIAAGGRAGRSPGPAADDLPLGATREMDPPWPHATGHRQWPAGSGDISRHA